MAEEKLIPNRDEIPESDKWDLSPLFKDDEEWESLFKELEANFEKIGSFKNRLSESVDIFKEAIDFYLEMSRKLETLYTYSHLRNDEDKTNEKYQAFYQRALNLHTRISELTSFIKPEIQTIPEETINDYLKDERIKDFKFLIEKIIRYKPHTLTEEVEEVLAKTGEMSHAPSQFFSMLDNADLKFGTIENDEGSIIELSHGNFLSFLMSPNRDLREKAFFQYYQAYDDHKQCIASSLSSSMKNDFFYTRVRKYKNCRHSALFSDDVPDKVYDNLIESVKKNLPPLFKYFNFRKKILGLKELHFYDTYVPIVKDVKIKMPYDEAVEICMEALKPLGDDYTKILRHGLSGGWVDRYENRGKRSGAYSSGCYDSPPYILMNYSDDNINSLYTLIHEAGHSMHSYYSKENQPYHYHEYTIFVAEVASTFNEALLSKYLLDYYKGDNQMKAYILNREIDNIRATLYRQTMFAEFERIAHSMIEENKPLTLQTITEIYKGLLKIYFGDSLVVDEALALECLRIPHFYSAFYVYKYATGISAAIALAGKVQKEGASARDSYLEFLKMGGSGFPLDELLRAGVDMRKPEPIIDAISYFEDLVDKFIETY